ncbi:MAG: hypothetical protein ACYTFK_07810 [Planctomycetota bacterium]|jgi:hypothetical protein
MFRYWLFSLVIIFALNPGPACFAVPKMQEAEDAAGLAEQIYCMARLAGVSVDKSKDILEVS